MWVEKKTAVPRSRNWLSRSLIRRAERGSRPDGRLVQEENLRVVHQRARQRHLLLHTMAVALDHVAGRGIVQLEQAQQFAGAVLGLLLRHAVEAGHEAQELPPAELAVEIGRVGHIAERAFAATGSR